MFGNRTISPPVAAQYVGAVDTTSTTDWIDYSSQDLQNIKDAGALPSDLQWGGITIDNTTGTGAVYYKLRARTAPGDPITNVIRVLAAGSAEQTLFGLIGGMPVTISVKKQVAGDGTRIYGEFFKGNY